MLWMGPSHVPLRAAVPAQPLPVAAAAATPEPRVSLPQPLSSCAGGELRAGFCRTHGVPRRKLGRAKSLSPTVFDAQPCPARCRHFLTRGAGCQWGGQRAPERAHSTPDSSQPSKVTGIFPPFLYLITSRVL